MRDRWLAVIVFGLALAFYLITLPPTIVPGDSGELIAASHTLSIAHPPGYPIYTLLGKVFSTAFPWGTIAYRYNVMSALISSVTVAMLYLLLRKLGIHKLISLGVGLAVASQEIFWLQATVAEVYPLNAFFTVLLLYVAVSGKRYRERGLVFLGYVAGLAVSHHLTLAYSVVCAVIVYFVYAGGRIRAGAAALSFLCFLAGLTSWAYIPFRAGLGVPLTWGETDTLKGFASHVFARRYGWRTKPFDFLPRVLDFGRFFRLAVPAFGIPLAALAVLGLASNVRRARLMVGFAGIIVLFAAHYAFYNIPDIEGHILPFMVGAAVLAALGTQWLAAGLARHVRIAKSVVSVAVLAIAIVNLLSLSPRQDPWFAYDYAAAIAESATDSRGESPVVLTATDLAWSSLVYLALVEARDMTVYALGISHPSVIGTSEAPASMAEAVQVAAQGFGDSKLVVLGSSEVGATGRQARICGLVYVLDTPAGRCRSPLDYEIRGVEGDPRDFFSRALSAEYSIHAARWCIQTGDSARARTYADRASEIARGDAQTYVDVSRVYMELGSLDEATLHLEEAVKAEPTHFYAHFALANVLALHKRQDEALAHYEQSLSGNPYPVTSYVNMAGIYQSRGDYGSAMTYFEKALEIDIGNPMANLGLGSVLEATGRPEEAMAHFDRALATDQRYADAYHAKGALLINLKRYDEALVVLRKGLGVKPQDAILLSDMGLLFLRTERPDSASEYLEDALEISPLLLSARGNLALAYEVMGLRSKAADEYRRYMEAAPPGRLRDMAAEALQRLAPGSGDEAQ